MNDHNEEQQGKLSIAEAKARPAALIVAAVLGVALVIAAIVIWALGSGNVSSLVGLAFAVLGAGFFYVGIAINAQKAYLFEDKVEIYYLWHHFTLRIRDITSVGSGFLGYLKIGTSSYHWRIFIYMSGAGIFTMP